MADELELVRRKYQEERDRRIRRDGNEQYRAVDEQELKHYVFDPYVEPGFSRDPRSDEVEVAVIGGGFGGMYSAWSSYRLGRSSDSSTR